jgi:hypothetical protein
VCDLTSLTMHTVFASIGNLCTIFQNLCSNC